jgi:hypothetical protein
VDHGSLLQQRPLAPHHLKLQARPGLARARVTILTASSVCRRRVFLHGGLRLQRLGTGRGVAVAIRGQEMWRCWP